jgi:hypothetical protein
MYFKEDNQVFLPGGSRNVSTYAAGKMPSI